MWCSAPCPRRTCSAGGCAIAAAALAGGNRAAGDAPRPRSAGDRAGDHQRRHRDDGAGDPRNLGAARPRPARLHPRCLRWCGAAPRGAAGAKSTLQASRAEAPGILCALGLLVTLDLHPFSYSLTRLLPLVPTPSGHRRRLRRTGIARRRLVRPGRARPGTTSAAPLGRSALSRAELRTLGRRPRR